MKLTSRTRAPLIALIAASVAALVTSASALPVKGTRAPGFRAKTLGGKTVSLDQVRKDPKANKKRIVLMDFWATWCPHCAAESGELQKLHQKYASKGVLVLGVSQDTGGAGDVKPFVKQHKLTYMQLVDQSGEAAQAYGVRPVPVTVIIDRNGKVYSTYLGFSEGMEKELDRDIQSLLR